MIRTAAVLATLLLAGCTSYSELQAMGPSLDLVTSKSPEAYAGCLAPKFMEIWPGNVSIIPDGENTVISAAGNGQTMFATVTIEPSGRVTLREMPHVNIGSAFERAQEATRSCI